MKALEARLKKRLEDFSNELVSVQEAPTAHHVHELRVLTRKLQAAFWMAQVSADKSSLQDIQKSLQNLMDLLGECRQWDVLKKDLKLYELQDSHLKKHRKDARKKLQKFLRKNSSSFSHDKLQRLLRSLTTFTSKNSQTIKKNLTQSLKKWPDHLPRKEKDLHKLRIETKKIIYRLELLGSTPRSLKKLQKSLGRVHDLEVFRNHYGHKKLFAADLARFLQQAQKTYGTLRP